MYVSSARPLFESIFRAGFRHENCISRLLPYVGKLYLSVTDDRRSLATSVMFLASADMATPPLTRPHPCRPVPIKQETRSPIATIQLRYQSLPTFRILYFYHIYLRLVNIIIRTSLGYGKKQKLSVSCKA